MAGVPELGADERPARVCATVFYDGRLSQWAGCTVKTPAAEVDPKTPLAHGWIMGDHSWASTRSRTRNADGSKERLPVENNMVFVSPIEWWPERLSSVDAGKLQSQIVGPIKEYGDYIHVRPGFGE